METPPDPGDTKDFTFEKLQELTTWAPEKEKQIAYVIRGLSVTNRYALAFCVCENGFYVIDCTHPSLMAKGSEGKKASLVDVGAFVVRTQWQPALIAVSSSGLTLAVCMYRDGVPVAFFYDVRCFSRRDPNSRPFQTIQLSSIPEAKILDFSWIPTDEEVFAVVLSDGSLGLFEIKGTAPHVLGTLSEVTNASCVSWSPKGKQFVIGKSDGSLAQYKPDLTLARAVAGPKNITVSTKNILWLSTFVFAVSYQKPGEIQPILVIINAPKTGEPVYTNFEDVCVGYSDQRRPFYHFWPIFEWNMFLVASNTALEVVVLACQSQDQTTGWLQLLPEETARAEIPLIGDEETFTLGIAVITCVPFPVLLISTTHGVMVTFRMTNRTKGPGGAAPNLCGMPENVAKVPGERPQMNIPLYSNATPGTSTSSATDQIKLAPSLSGMNIGKQSPLLQSTNQLPQLSLATPKAENTSNDDTSGTTPTTIAPPFGGEAMNKPAFAGFGSGLSTTPFHGFIKTEPDATAATTRGPEQHPSKDAPAKAASSTLPIATTIITNKTSVPVVPVAKVSSGPSKIPSRAVQEFMGKVSSLGRQLETLALENGENGDLSHRMDVMTKVLDDLTSFFNDAAVRLNEHEHILEERLHVVEEGLLVVERCSDPQFLECLRNLPLDPLQRRKFEVLEKNIKELEHKLKTIDKAIDIELDVMEEKRASPEDDQFVVARKLIKELDTTSLHLQKKLSEIERESRRLALKEPQRATVTTASPAEIISRLYPSLDLPSRPRVSAETARKIRTNVKSYPARITRHEIDLFTHRNDSKQKTAASRKGSTEAVLPVSEVRPTFIPVSTSHSTGISEKLSIVTGFGLPLNHPQPLTSTETTAKEPPKSTPLKTPSATGFAGFAFGKTFQQPDSLVQRPLESNVATPSQSKSPPFQHARKTPINEPVSVKSSTLASFLAKPITDVPNASGEGLAVSVSNSDTFKLLADVGGFKLSGNVTSPESSGRPAPLFGSASPGSLVFGAASDQSVATSGPMADEIDTTTASVSSKPTEVKQLFGGGLVASPAKKESSEDSKPVFVGFHSNKVQTALAKPADSVQKIEQNAASAENDKKMLRSDGVGNNDSVAPASVDTSSTTPTSTTPSLFRPSTTSTFSGGTFSFNLSNSSSGTGSMFSSLPSSDALPGVSTGGDQTKPLFGANTFSAFGQLPVASATSETVRSAESSGVNSAASLATNSMFEASAIATTGSLNMFGNQLTDTNADKERLAFGSGGFGAPLTGTANILNSSGTAAATESKAEKGIFGAGAFGGLSLDAGSTAPTVEPVKNPFATQGFGFGIPATSSSTTTNQPFGGFGSASLQTFPPPSGDPAKSAWSGSSTAPQPSQSFPSLSGGFSGFKISNTAAPTATASPFGGTADPFATQAAASGFPAGNTQLSGFGTPQASGGFGSTSQPAFGGAPFGQSSGFGTSGSNTPAGGFGSTPFFSSPQPEQQQSGGNFIWGAPGGFAAYAQQPSVSFGALASQSGTAQPPPGFGAAGLQNLQSSGFGSLAGQGIAQPTAAPQSSAFTQYR